MSDYPFHRRLMGLAQVFEGSIRLVFGRAPSLVLPAARKLARKRGANRA